jgi:hypothetical protein
MKAPAIPGAHQYRNARAIILCRLRFCRRSARESNWRHSWVIVEGATQPYLYWQDDDGDGLAAYLDPDDDGDGVDDASDDYPLEAAVSLDTDGDGLADDWNAGCDPTCQDASGLTLDGDDDNDGVADGEDTDPLDPNVCRDLDGDTADDCSVGTDGFGSLDDFDPSNDGL